MRSTKAWAGYLLVVGLYSVAGCSGDAEGVGGSAGERGTSVTTATTTVTSASSVTATSTGPTTGAGGAAGAMSTSGSGGASGTTGTGGRTGTGGSISDAGLDASADAGPRSDAGCQFSDVMPPALFASLFPDIQAPYTYEGLASAAVRYYPAFLCTGDLNLRKREAAAFLANVVHETIGFKYAEEIACAGMCATAAACQVYIGGRDPRCAGKCYDGRGAIQLSFCNNYIAASTALGLGSQLVDMPELVATNPELAVATAVWFWMIQGRCHQAIVNGMGFGATVRAINGIECTSSDPVRIDQWQDRLQWFNTITAAMGIPAGDTTGCR
jgi:predicted chitinase